MQKIRNKVKALTTYLFWKNIIDRVFALLALIVLLPFFILIAICIRIDSPGNPLFRQERVGKDGRPFIVYKFRTMYVDNDDSQYKAVLWQYVAGGAATNLEAVHDQVNSPRVTRVGAILRKTNIDELPQLLNIVKGEMAFIGPRPDIPFAVAMYQERHKQRFAVKPGLTGLWQVSGRRSVSFEDMVKMDIEYISRQSLLLDLKIMLVTPLVAIKEKSI